MALRRCVLCGQETAATVCDRCLGLPGRDLLDVVRGLSGVEMDSFLSQRSRVPTIELADLEIPDDVRALLPRQLCERYVVVPVARAGPSLIVALTDPDDADVLAAMAEAAGMPVEPVIASAEAITAKLA